MDIVITTQYTHNLRAHEAVGACALCIHIVNIENIKSLLSSGVSSIFLYVYKFVELNFFRICNFFALTVQTYRAHTIALVA